MKPKKKGKNKSRFSTTEKVGLTIVGIILSPGLIVILAAGIVYFLYALCIAVVYFVIAIIPILIWLYNANKKERRSWEEWRESLAEKQRQVLAKRKEVPREIIVKN